MLRYYIITHNTAWDRESLLRRRASTIISFVVKVYRTQLPCSMGAMSCNIKFTQDDIKARIHSTECCLEFSFEAVLFSANLRTFLDEPGSARGIG